MHLTTHNYSLSLCAFATFIQVSLPLQTDDNSSNSGMSATSISFHLQVNLLPVSLHFATFIAILESQNWPNLPNISLCIIRNVGITRVPFDSPMFGWINLQLCLLFRKVRNAFYFQSLVRLSLFCTFTDVGAYWTLSDVAKLIQSYLDFNQKLALTELCRM